MAAGLAGGELRAARQGIIDAVGQHHAKYGGSYGMAAAYARPRKRRNCLQIIEDVAPRRQTTAEIFPGAAVLRALPPLPPPRPPPPLGGGSGAGPLPSAGCRHGQLAEALALAVSAVGVEADVARGRDAGAGRRPWVVLVLGGVGAGKSGLLEAVRRSLGQATVGDLGWDASKAVVSQFGEEAEARLWLGGIGAGGFASVAPGCFSRLPLPRARTLAAAAERQAAALPVQG
eukprot:SAG11_NODE_960_length_6382_cov_8.585071_1_plen_231_part_00